MKKGILLNESRDEVVARKIRHCRGIWDRLCGLLGTSTLAEDEVCWLLPCNSVHTIGMRYAIDVYFLNKDNEVISIMRNMKPNRLSPILWSAHSVLEFKADSKRNIKVGDQITWRDSSSDTLEARLKYAGTSKLGNARGQSMVEFFLTFMTFLVIIFAVSDILRISFNWATLQYASTRGIRVAKMLPNDADKPLEIRNEIQRCSGAMGLPLTNNDVSITMNTQTINVVTSRNITLTPVLGFLLTFGGNRSGVYTLRVREVIRNAPL